MQLQSSNHERSIRSVKFSPCGKLLASCSFDGVTLIWQVPTDDASLRRVDLWIEVNKMEGHENEVKDVSWSIFNEANNNYYVATCGRDKTVWIWEISMLDADYDADCIAVLQEHLQDVKAVVWHPKQFVLVSCSADDSIKFWKETESELGSDKEWHCAHTIKGAHESTVWKVDFHVSGNYFVSCSEDGSLKIWNYFTLECLYSVKLSCRPLYSLALRLETIAISSGDGFVYLVNFNLGEKENDYHHLLAGGFTTEKIASGHLGDILSVAWLNNTNILASAGDDNSIKLWE